jgi:hypothetical protein
MVFLLFKKNKIAQYGRIEEKGELEQGVREQGRTEIFSPIFSHLAYSKGKAS